MSKRLEYPQSESSEEENSEDEESEAGSDDDDENEEEEEIKMNKVIACKSMKLREWKAVCAKMNTSEITNGSRWIQEVDDSVDLETYEERFLVKWNDLSFLHCSWETQRDLLEFCEGAKGRLSTFFRKARDCLLYDADERLDGVSFIVLSEYHYNTISTRFLIHMPFFIRRTTLIHRGFRLSVYWRYPTTVTTSQPRSSLT